MVFSPAGVHVTGANSAPGEGCNDSAARAAVDKVVLIELHPSGQQVPAHPGQTLWSALHAAGVAWPVSCRNGSCRTCMGRLLAGRVRYLVEWPGLLPEEKAMGHVLPCVACAETPVVLAGPGD